MFLAGAMKISKNADKKYNKSYICANGIKKNCQCQNSKDIANIAAISTSRFIWVFERQSDGSLKILLV